MSFSFLSAYSNKIGQKQSHHTYNVLIDYQQKIVK
jgi:hypothetical protein